jgi:hypothetical protein
MNNLIEPYQGDSANGIYNLLFCDNLQLYSENLKKKNIYPWDILLSDTTDLKGLQKIAKDNTLESRVKLLAYYKLLSEGHKSESKDLLGVIVEVGLDEGLDVLASYKDGTARYINYTEKTIIWDAKDAQSNALTEDLFNNSLNIIKQIGPWDQPRRPAPGKGNLRISFLVSDGLYFGEGPMNALFGDPMAGPALNAALALMQYITEKSQG